MSYDRSYRQTTTTTRNTRANRGRPLYAPPPPPPGGHNRNHSLLGYWVPLIAIGTVAVGGLAAWAWSERSEHDDDEYPDDKPPRPQTGLGGAYPTHGSQPYPGPIQPPRPGDVNFIPVQGEGPPPPVGADVTGAYGASSSSYYEASSSQTTRGQAEAGQQGFFGRVQGAMRRTPSPQQFFDSASKQVMGGMAAAGAALTSIIENPDSRDHSEDRRRRGDERDGFSDHERWSEEAEERQKINITESGNGKRSASARDDKGKGHSKRTVAVVLSSDVDAGLAEAEGAFHTEHGVSIHFPTPQRFNPDRDIIVHPFSSAHNIQPGHHRHCRPDLRTQPQVSAKPQRACRLHG